jgi:hypothetical protein
MEILNKIFQKLNLRVDSVFLQTEKRGKEFKECNKCKKPLTLGTLEPCTHELCVECIDILYDDYQGSIDVLFECPFCNVKINSLSYKRE